LSKTTSKSFPAELIAEKCDLQFLVYEVDYFKSSSGLLLFNFLMIILAYYLDGNCSLYFACAESLWRTTSFLNLNPGEF
jgi:hypothetical protein